MVDAANASKELAINSFMLAEAHPPKETHRMLLCQRKTETFWIKQVELTVKAVQYAGICSCTWSGFLICFKVLADPLRQIG